MPAIPALNLTAEQWDAVCEISGLPGIRAVASGYSVPRAGKPRGWTLTVRPQINGDAFPTDRGLWSFGWLTWLTQDPLRLARLVGPGAVVLADCYMPPPWLNDDMWLIIKGHDSTLTLIDLAERLTRPWSDPGFADNIAGR